MSHARKARWSAAVAELTAFTWAAPQYSASSRSNSLTFGPVVNQPLRKLVVTASMSESSMEGLKNGMRISAMGNSF